MDQIGINGSEFREFLTSTKSINSLNILQNVYPNLNAVFNSQIGKEILSDDLGRISELLAKAYKQTASDLELAELRYLRDTRLPKLINRVNAYLKSLVDVKRYSATNNEKGEGNG